MSTRSAINFYDETNQSFTVYKHSDGYPEGKHGIVQAIKNAEDYAWLLPRFEAGEYAAAFIAANKQGIEKNREQFKAMNWTEKQIKQSVGGNIYVTTSPEDHPDLEYIYEYGRDRGMRLSPPILTIKSRPDISTDTWIAIFTGTLEDALKQFKDK